jgi:hypothetical protein
MSKGTPMWDVTGLMPSADRPSNTVCSYASVHDNLSAKSKSYATKFKQFVLDYAVEWQQVVTQRVDSGLKKSELLRRELDHYQKKVEAMRLSTNQSLAKGKAVTPANAEKLGRNEEKLISSKQTYNKIATDLCILMEEVTERAWRDLHPLLIKCAQFDMTLSGDESKILSSLNQAVNELKRVATDNGLSPQPRLKDLASLTPELLSTRPGGVSGLMITSGGEPSRGSSYSPNGAPNMAQPPGSVGPQGLGGFPVQVDFAAVPPSRDSSFNSYASGPPSGSRPEPLSTMSMLTISQSSAPAPTLEDVYSASRGRTMSAHSAPVSGNMPPLPNRSTTLSPANRSSSFNDNSVYSDYSGYGGSQSVAAAPAAPPPPPPRSAPPVPPSYGAPQNYGAPPQNYAAPQSFAAPQSYGAPSYGAPSYGAPPMASATAMGPASGGQSYWAPPSQSMNAAPFDEPAGTNAGTNPFDI